MISTTKLFCKIVSATILAMFFLSSFSIVFASGGSVNIEPLYSYNDNKYKFIYELSPGDFVEDSLLLRNNSKNEINKASLYPADAEIQEDGTFVFNEAGNPGGSIAEWIKIEETEIILNPGENKVVNFEISVPKDATYGDYPGGLVAATAKSFKTGGLLDVSVRAASKLNVKITDKPQTIEKKLKVSLSNKESLTKTIHMARVGIVTLLIAMVAITIVFFYRKK
jgi:hypothetical protein